MCIWQIDQLLCEEDSPDLGCCPACGVVLAAQVITVKSTEITFTDQTELL
ncbi:MAG: hypothetical protein HY617_03250 [Candidatus Sungbacteria bacterium]|nr:hypothetical protein [Candidatus Sungbacteria bacterium]